jgi:hypothetical protein
MHEKFKIEKQLKHEAAPLGAPRRIFEQSGGALRGCLCNRARGSRVLSLLSSFR